MDHRKIFFPWVDKVLTESLKADLTNFEILDTFETLCGLKKAPDFLENSWINNGVVEVSG